MSLFTSPTAPQRRYGVTMVLATVLLLALLSHHPMPRGEDIEHLVHDIARVGPLGRIVHGGLIMVMCLFCLGFSGAADALGRTRWFVRAGWGAFVVATAAMVLAATINGFAVPGLADWLVSHLPLAASDVEVRLALALCRELNLSATWIGLTSWALATGLWSLELLCRPGTRRAVGVLGLVCLLAFCVGVISGRIAPTLDGLLVFATLEAIWTLAVAVLLVRQTLHGPESR